MKKLMANFGKSFLILICFSTLLSGGDLFAQAFKEGFHASRLRQSVEIFDFSLAKNINSKKETLLAIWQDKDIDMTIVESIKIGRNEVVETMMGADSSIYVVVGKTWSFKKAKVYRLDPRKPSSLYRVELSHKAGVDPHRWYLTELTGAEKRKIDKIYHAHFLHQLRNSRLTFIMEGYEVRKERQAGEIIVTFSSLGREVASFKYEKLSQNRISAN